MVVWPLAGWVKNLLEKNDPVCQTVGMATGGLNSELNNINNDTNKIERNKTEPGDSIWGPMILNNMCC